MSDVAIMHARATRLATDAMNAAALLPVTGEGDYAKAQRLYADALAGNRADGVARHAAHNQALRVASHIRKFGGYQDALPF